MTASSLAPSLIRLLASIFVGLVLFSLTTLHPRLRRPEAAGIRRAMLGWWLPALVATAAIVGGPLASAAIFTAVGLGCLRELLRLWPDERHPVVDGLTAAAIAPMHALAIAGALDLAAALLLAWAGAALPLVRAAICGPDGLTAASSRRLFCLLLAGLALAHVPALRASADGAALMSILLLAVMVNDAAQYAFGKALGRRPLAPRLSPRKTWGGLVGGVITTAVILAVAAPSVLPVAWTTAALVGVLLSVTGLLGDLLISAIKRDVGVKDTGAVIPGQGGLLDRCDSLLIAAPLFFHTLAPWLRGGG